MAKPCAFVLYAAGVLIKAVLTVKTVTASQGGILAVVPPDQAKSFVSGAEAC